MHRKGDVDALQAVIETLTFADVEGEGERSLADANLVKLARLAQLCLEYLLHCQGKVRGAVHSWSRLAREPVVASACAWCCVSLMRLGPSPTEPHAITQLEQQRAAAVEDALRWQKEAPPQPQPSRPKLETTPTSAVALET